MGVLEKVVAVLRDSLMEYWNVGSKFEVLFLGLIFFVVLCMVYRFVFEIFMIE